MGIVASCGKSSSNSFRGIRVVQLGGLVQEFDKPVKVKHLTAQNPRHFVCSRRGLQTVKPCPLPAEEELQVGGLYFLLPFAALEGELSHSHLLSLASKLIAAAAKKAHAPKPLSTQKQCTATTNAAVAKYGFDAGDYSTQCQNLGTEKNGKTGYCPELEMAYRQHVLSRNKTWRPRLNTIEEGWCVC